MTYRILFVVLTFNLFVLKAEPIEKDIEQFTQEKTEETQRLRPLVQKYLEWRRVINPFLVGKLLESADSKNPYVKITAHAVFNCASHVVAHKYLNENQDTKKLVKGGLVFAAGEEAARQLDACIDTYSQKQFPAVGFYSPIRAITARLSALTNFISCNRLTYAQKLKNEVLSSATKLQAYEVPGSVSALRNNGNPNLVAMAQHFNRESQLHPNNKLLEAASGRVQDLLQYQRGLKGDCAAALIMGGKSVLFNQINNGTDWAIEYIQH